MSDLLERLAATVREWQETRLVPGKEADAVLNAAPELIAVARAFREYREARGSAKWWALCKANGALESRLREIYGGDDA